MEELPETPDEFEFLGGLKLEEHMALTPVVEAIKHEYEVTLSFFDDLLITYETVWQIHNFFQSPNFIADYFTGAIGDHKSGLDKLMNFFSIASQKKSGLILFATSCRSKYAMRANGGTHLKAAGDKLGATQPRLLKRSRIGANTNQPWPDIAGGSGLKEY